MQRRALLAALGTAGAAALAGCGGAAPRSQPSGPAADATDTPASAAADLGGVELPVPRSEIDVRLPRDRIPAIVDPAYAADWTDLSVPEGSLSDGGPLLPDDAPVVGVARDGRTRAYPLRILDWHEVVNDDFGGPLLVTYCPLCGSAVVAERRVDGQATVFGVSGRLWRDDLVLYDRATESWWSQLLAAAIRGPLTGERLDLVPSSLTSWGEWRAAYPGTRVLLPPPHSNTVRGPDATFEYFSAKYTTDEQLIGFAAGEDGGPAPRRLVLGIAVDGTARAYPFDVVREAGVVNDRVADRPVVVTVTPARTLVAYDRRVEGRELRFEADGEAHLRADGSRWERSTGRAVVGPHEGARLSPATDVPPMFWKGWTNFHPQTSLYEGA